MQKIRRASCPFVNLPERKPGRWGLRITPAVMKRCHWVEPLLVAQIKFTEWTSDDQLRQPVFLGAAKRQRPKGSCSRIVWTPYASARLAEYMVEFEVLRSTLGGI